MENHPDVVQQVNGQSLWYIQAMENYSAIKRKRLLIGTTTWINLQIIMLRRKQSLKVTYCMILFM